MNNSYSYSRIKYLIPSSYSLLVVDLPLSLVPILDQSHTPAKYKAKQMSALKDCRVQNTPN